MEYDYHVLENEAISIDLESHMEKLFSNTRVLKGNLTQIWPIVKGNNYLVLAGCEDGKVCLISNDIQYLQGHTGQVRRVMATSDEKYGITSSRDKTVKLWDLENGELFKSFDCGSDVVSIDVYKYLIAAGMENGKVMLLDINNDQIKELDGHTEFIRWIGFTDDGSKLTSLSNDKTIKVYNQEGHLLGSLKGHTDWVTRISFTPDNNTAISGSKDKTIRFWDLTSLTEIVSLEGHKDEIWSVAVSPNGRYAASGSNDKKIILWNIPEKKLEFIFEGHVNQIPHIKISNNSKYIASASYDKTVKLWNIEEKKLEASFEGHTHFVRCVEFTSDGKYVFSGGADKTVRKWCIETKTTSKVLKGHTDWIRRLAITPDNQKIVSAGKDKTLRLWSLNGDLEHTFTGHKDEIWGLCITPDGDYALSGSYDKTLKMWNLRNKTLEHTFEGHEGWINFVFITPDGKYAITPSYDSTIGIWDLDQKLLSCKLKGHTNAVVRMCLSKDGHYACTASRDNTVKVWDISNRALIVSFDHYTDICLSLAISDNGLTLVTGCNDKAIRFYDLTTKTFSGIIEEAHGGDVNRILITSDNQLAISSSDDKTIKVWSISSRTLQWAMEGHTNIVTWIEMTQDCKYIISASRDNTVKCWDLYNKSLLFSYNKHTDVIYNILISPNGENVISGSFDKTLNINKLHPIVSVQRKHYGIYEVNINAANKILDYQSRSFSPDIKDGIIFPLHINILHLYAYSDKTADMHLALQADTPYFCSSIFGSPLSLAIKRNNFEIINLIIAYFIRVSQEKPVNYQVFSTLKEDLYLLFNLKLSSICELFTILPLLGNRKDLPKYLGCDIHLPEILFSQMHYFSKSLFQFLPSNAALIQTNYFAVPFRLALEPGSTQSLELLDSLKSSPNSELFISKLIIAIIDYKWSWLRIYFIAEFINYAIYLVLMCAFIQQTNDNIGGYISILFFNSTCLFLEILQFLPNKSSYLKSFWNIFDILRIGLCYVLAFIILIHGEFKHQNILVLCLMILCWIKGLSYFRMFNQTRYFVTMVGDVIFDSLGFGIIFFYSIFAFSNLFQILSDKEIGFLEIFKKTFEGIFGGGDTETKDERIEWLIFFFSTLIVTVIMLNLLISQFGDTYDRVMMEREETSNRNKISMIYEIEKMLFWKRQSGIEKYMIICDRVESEIQDWNGKIKAIISTFKEGQEAQEKSIESLKKNIQANHELVMNSIKK